MIDLEERMQTPLRLGTLDEEIEHGKATQPDVKRQIKEDDLRVRMSRTSMRRGSKNC